MMMLFEATVVLGDISRPLRLTQRRMHEVQFNWWTNGHTLLQLGRHNVLPTWCHTLMNYTLNKIKGHGQKISTSRYTIEIVAWVADGWFFEEAERLPLKNYA